MFGASRNTVSVAVLVLLPRNGAPDELPPPVPGAPLLPVEEVRKIAPFLRLTSAEGGWRVVVMDEAERADQAAVQNTLLKTLEEPPPKTVLLLVCAAPQKLLPRLSCSPRSKSIPPSPER